MNEYHEELEYDLLPTVDLLDFWRGTLSARRLWVLIKQLPTDSRFVQSAYPDAAAVESWSATDYILADLIDLTYAAAGGKGQDYPRPQQLIQRRKDRETRDRLLAEQAERNRLRDASA